MAAKARKEIWVWEPLFCVGTAGVGCGLGTGRAAQQFGMPQSAARHLVQTAKEATGADMGAKGSHNSSKLNIMENTRFIYLMRYHTLNKSGVKSVQRLLINLMTST